MPKRKSLRQEGYRNSLTPNSLTPDPSPKGRGVITIRAKYIPTKTNHSPLFWRGAGGEASFLLAEDISSHKKRGILFA